MNSNKKNIIFLFFLSFLIRSIVFFFFTSKEKHYWNYDSVVYNQVALQIVNGNGISNENGSPAFLRVPGYSIFLATCYKVFNFDIVKTLFIQVFIASFIPVLICFLSLAIFPGYNLVAFLSGLFSCIQLGFVLFSGLCMTESLFLIFWLLFLILFFYQKQEIKPMGYQSFYFLRFFIAGIFLGLASMFRPVGHYFIIILSLVILFLDNNIFLIKIKKILLIFLGWFLVVLPWLLRNYLLAGLLFFHTLPGIHFLKHSAARLASQSYNISYMDGIKIVSKELDNLIVLEEKNKNRKLNEIEVCNLAENVSKKYFKQNYLNIVKHAFINMFKTSFSLYIAEVYYICANDSLPDYTEKRSLKDLFLRFLKPNVNNNFLIFLTYYEILIFLFILLGFMGFILSFIVRSPRVIFEHREKIVSRGVHVFSILIFISFFIFLSFACGFARLRLPIEPFLIILSIKFWIEIFKKERNVV